MRKQLDLLPKMTALLVISMAVTFSFPGASSRPESLCGGAWILEPIVRALTVALGPSDWRIV